jgi:hypothetical protein
VILCQEMTPVYECLSWACSSGNNGKFAPLCPNKRTIMQASAPLCPNKRTIMQAIAPLCPNKRTIMQATCVYCADLMRLRISDGLHFARPHAEHAKLSLALRCAGVSLPFAGLGQHEELPTKVPLGSRHNVTLSRHHPSHAWCKTSGNGLVKMMARISQ